MTTVFASKCACSANLERKYKNKIKVKKRCRDDMNNVTDVPNPGKKSFCRNLVIILKNLLKRMIIKRRGSMEEKWK
jgi:hypothetical protein